MPSISASHLEELARAVELTDLESTGNELAGRGRMGEVRLRARRNGAIDVVIDSDELEPSLKLYPSSVARGEKDLVVGVRSVDEAFVIQGKNPAAVIRLLRKEDVASSLTALAKAARDVHVEDGHLRLALDGRLAFEHQRQTLKEAIAAAERLNAASLVEFGEAGRRRTEAGHAPIRPLRDRSGDDLPPVHPLYSREWQRRARIERNVAIAAGIPFGLFCLWAAMNDGVHKGWPIWAIIVSIFVLTGFSVMLMRCPACDATLERRGLLALGRPHVCKRCGVRVK